MRAKTQHTARGSGDKTGRSRKDKKVENRDIRRYVEGRGMNQGTWVYKMDITGTFRKESREFEVGGFGVD